MATKKLKLDQLISSDSDDGDDLAGSKQLDNTFSINTSYAKNYDNWRSKEELQKLKDRLGDAADGSESSSDETTSIDTDSEDEIEFFRTLSCVRSHDPKIYDAQASFFEKSKAKFEAGPGGGEGESPKKKKKPDKPFLLKDHDREMILRIADGQDPEEDDDDKVPIIKTEDATYVEEQKAIKNSFKDALTSIGENDNEDNSDLLKKKTRTKVEMDQQAEDYKKWLKGETDKLKKGTFSKEEEKELKFLRGYWNSTKLDEDEAFLKDFFLNKKYVQDSDEADDVTGGSTLPGLEAENLSDDEAHVQEMETFEHKYNFRFEEPDQEFVKKYPRTIEDSLRRTSTKRKEDREKSKNKKALEKEQKLAEVQQYKALKRKEIQKRIQKLQEISGEQINFEDADIDEDFDPHKHDTRMQQLFDEQFYKDDHDDEEKPVFPYDEFIDGELGPPAEDTEPGTSTSKRKRKKKRRGRGRPTDGEDEDDGNAEEIFLHAIANSKSRGSGAEASSSKSNEPPPVFDSSIHGTYEEYLNEYFKHDFEDIVGGIPCRFRYRNVVPNDFGLTVDEILKADDKELNAWASLKKTYQYRPIDEETYEVQAFRKKATLGDKKKKVLKSLFEEPESEDEEAEEESKEEPKPSTSTSGKAKEEKGKNKKKGAGKRKKAEAEPRVDEDRLLAYGINPKKYDKRLKFKK